MIGIDFILFFLLEVLVQRIDQLSIGGRILGNSPSACYLELLILVFPAEMYPASAVPSGFITKQ